MKKVWQSFFDRVSACYECEMFTRNTLFEVDFICEELKLTLGAKILDVGCGTGRHSIKLARRGYQVTGIDFSSGMLAQASENARKAGVTLELIECAAQNFSSTQRYDAVISLCEGALCLFEDDDDIWGRDMAIFANMAEALKDDGKFLVTVLNAFRLIRSINAVDIANGTVDLLTLSSRFENEISAGKGEETFRVKGIERYYTPPELVRMVNRIGLKIDKIYGGTAGNWRQGPVELDEIEFMAVGHKKPAKR